MRLDDIRELYGVKGPGKDRLGGKSAPEADTTTRSKSDPLAPVQYHEPKQVLKGGATPSYGMETRSPLQFNPDGSKVQQPDIFRRATEAIDPVQHLIKPALGTAASNDPVSQIMGGAGNTAGVMDPPANYASAIWSKLTGAEPRDPHGYQKAEEGLAQETPQWVRQLMEFGLGSHGAGGGTPRRPTPAEFAKANTREGAPIAPIIETLKRQDAQVPPQAPQPVRQTSAAKSRPSYMASPEEVQAGNDKNFAPGSYGYSPRRTPEQMKADKEAAIRAKFGNVQPMQQQQGLASKDKLAEQLAQKEEANRRNPSTKQEEPAPLTLAQKVKKKIKDVQNALLPSDKEMEQRWAENVTLHEQRLDPEKKYNQEQQQQGKAPTIHKDSPENLSEGEFKQAVKRGVVGPSEPLGRYENELRGEPFSRIKREVPGRDYRGVQPDIDQGLKHGYKTEDIARYVAHKYAIANDPSYLGKFKQYIQDIYAGKKVRPPEIPEENVTAAYQDMMKDRLNPSQQQQQKHNPPPQKGWFAQGKAASEKRRQSLLDNPPPPAGGYVDEGAWEFRDKKDIGKTEVETRGRGAPMKERLVRRADKVPLREGLEKNLKDAATATDYNTVRDAIDGAKNNKLISVPNSKYLNKLGSYLFRQTKGGENANLEVDTYLKATGGEFGKPVPIADLYPRYLEKARSITPENTAKKRGNEFYIKDFDTFKRHFLTFGKRAGESYDTLPDSPAAWIVDGDHVILSPHIPGQEAARAYSLPLETGLKVAETMPEPPKTVPDVQTGRVPGGTSYKGSYYGTETVGQQQQAKPPSRIPPPEKPPLDGDVIPPKKPKTQRTPAERRLEGEVAMKSEFDKDPLREGSSGLPRDPNAPFKSKSDRVYWDHLERLFSPSTISNTSRAAAQIIRAIEGTGKRQVAVALGKLEQFETMVGALNREAQLDVVHWVQTGGKEGNLAAVMDKMGREDKLKFRDFATALAHTFDVHKQEIQSLDNSEIRHFIENYLPQLWKDPPRARDTAYTFMNERKIPTYKDGMFDKNGKPTGREPITTNPIEMTMRYMAAMRKFLDIRAVVKEGLETKYVRQFKRSQTQYPDVVELNFVGRGGKKYVSNKDFARVFNNWVSRGFKEGPEMTGLIDGLQRMTNLSVAIKLGFSGFHATTMVVEAWFAGLADGIKDLSKGNASRAVKKFANSPLAPYKFYKMGKELESIYLQEDRFAITKEQQEIGNIAASTNLTVKGIDPIYRLTDKNDYLRPVERLLTNIRDKETRKEVIQSQLNQLKSDFKTDPGKNLLQKIANPIVQTVDIAARLMQTVGAPLFQRYIPRVKAGVWYTRMSEFMRDNPGLSRAEYQEHANKLADIVDDQFGELNQNNLFQNQHIKQLSNLLMTSPGWKLGSWRLLSQGGAELVGKVGKTIKSGKAQELDDRAAYIISALAGTVGMGMLIQWAMTGKGPESGQDLIMPQTGGTTPEGEKERTIPPGYIKEPIGVWEHGPVQQLLQSAAPAVTSTYELYTNKDYRNDPTRDTTAPLSTRLKQVGKYMLEGLQPISAQQTLSKPYPDSGLNTAMRGLGFRPANKALTNPQDAADRAQHYGEKDWQRKLRHEEQDKDKKTRHVTPRATSTRAIKELYGVGEAKPKRRGLSTQEIRELYAQ